MQQSLLKNILHN